MLRIRYDQFSPPESEAEAEGALQARSPPSILRIAYSENARCSILHYEGPAGLLLDSHVSLIWVEIG